jgi:hypothetical protein
MPPPSHPANPTHQPTGANLSTDQPTNQPPQVMSLPAPTVVKAQSTPDPEFTSLGPNPPNPEEGKGVWTLAYETGGLVVLGGGC